MAPTPRRKRLLERICAETGSVVTNSRNAHILAGMFNRYRPHGDGLERVLAGEDVECAVRSRIKRVYEVSTPGSDPRDLYFVVRQPQPVDPPSAVRHATDYLHGIERLADFMKDSETRAAVKALTVTAGHDMGFAPDEDAPALLHDCIGDFLAKFQPKHNELFFLKEALYSMANDYFLMGWMLWPAIQETTQLPDLLDPYFAFWRHGLRLEFSASGRVHLRIPGDAPP
jgi:hypothetical protein